MSRENESTHVQNRIFLCARLVDDLKSWILMILSESCVVVGRKPRNGPIPGYRATDLRQ